MRTLENSVMSTRGKHVLSDPLLSLPTIVSRVLCSDMCWNLHTAVPILGLGVKVLRVKGGDQGSHLAPLVDMNDL